MKFDEKIRAECSFFLLDDLICEYLSSFLQRKEDVFTFNEIINETRTALFESIAEVLKKQGKKFESELDLYREGIKS